MEQTKPRILINKYRSILIAAVVVEAVSFLVSLTDSLIAGNVVGEDALAAIGLLAPFFSIATLFAAVINSGTVLNYTRQIGLFRKERAHAFFSQGVYLALAVGTLFLMVMVLFKESILAGFAVTDSMRRYADDYYDIIVFYFLLTPISCVLDNTVIADGGEKLSAVANSVQIVGNILLSWLFSLRWGVQGIAAGTVVCKLLFIALICRWFLSDKNTIRLVRTLNFPDCRSIAGQGAVRATTFAMTALMTWLLNAFVLSRFGDESFKILVVVEKVLGLSSVFLGLSMTIQPLVGTLRGEKNSKAARYLFQRACRDLALTGLGVSVLLLAFAEPVARAFGLKEAELLGHAASAVRITSLTLVFSAALVFFFICYFLLNRNSLAILLSTLKDFVFPLGLPVLFAMLFNTPTAVWAGLSAAPVASLLVTAAVALALYGKAMMPFMISRDRDDRIFIYAFEVNEKSAAAMSAEAGELLETAGYSPRLQILAGVCIEDMLMTIRDKNPPQSKKLEAECTLILEEDGCKLILRDNGVIFDLTDSDGELESFRQYVVSSVMTTMDAKTYLKTNGYNRHEFFFRKA